jgi:hypothetical protein
MNRVFTRGIYRKLGEEVLGKVHHGEKGGIGVQDSRDSNLLRAQRNAKAFCI